jgi:rhodanese-related sulfurtransferase
MENLALETAEHLRSAGISISSYRCTIGGIKENDIDDSLGASVNCNPAGQAASINKENADLVIEMGLCLGHDIIFHEALKVPHTVFLVKDRVFNGNPARALASYRDSADKFIESLDSSFNMRSAEWLNGRLLSDDPPVIIDLRSPEAFAEASIKGSVNILLKQLPEKYMTLNDVRGRDIICLCNGSVQSAYAAGYLFTRGFKKVYNLSGGFRKFADSFSGFIVSGGRSA